MVEQRRVHTGCVVEGRFRPWRELLTYVLIMLAALVAVNLVLRLVDLGVLDYFISSVYDYMLMMIPPTVIGILIGGLIDVFVPRRYIERFLAGHDAKTLLRATGLGFLASTCLHGILAIAVELYRKGASTPSAIAFLMASPWANIVVTILLIALFKVYGILIVVLALAIALITASIYVILDKKGIVECLVCGYKGRNIETSWILG